MERISNSHTGWTSLLDCITTALRNHFLHFCTVIGTFAIILSAVTSVWNLQIQLAFLKPLPNFSLFLFCSHAFQFVYNLEEIPKSIRSLSYSIVKTLQWFPLCGLLNFCYSQIVDLLVGWNPVSLLLPPPPGFEGELYGKGYFSIFLLMPKMTSCTLVL